MQSFKRLPSKSFLVELGYFYLLRSCLQKRLFDCKMETDDISSELQDVSTLSTVERATLDNNIEILSNKWKTATHNFGFYIPEGWDTMSTRDRIFAINNVLHILNFE